MRALVTALGMSLTAGGALADGEYVKPPAALVVDGVPPIPAALAKDLEPYSDFRPHTMLAWHPQRRELLAGRRLTATVQVHRVAEPGANPEPLTDFPDRVADARYPFHRPDFFVFARGAGGNEVYRLYREDVVTREVTPFTTAEERVESWSWGRKDDTIVYVAQAIDRNNPERTAKSAIHVVDPLRPETDRVVVRLAGGGWFAPQLSPDGKRIAILEYVSATEGHLWVIDAASGKMRRVTKPGKGETVSYGPPMFTKDGRALIATSDRGAEFHRLVHVPINGGKERVLTAHIAHDVEEFDISYDVDKVAFATNEDGASVLRFLDLATFKELPRPPLVQGVIGGLRWRPGSEEVAFDLRSAKSPGDVFSYDLKSNRTVRWTNGNNPRLNMSRFAEPRLVKWKSFDGLEISGFHYHPPARFEGKRPVNVNIHGGPEAQARPGFIGTSNYFVNELGVAVIYPNVRGSRGFGKTFLKLDNGMKREDSVKDIGALLDWIAAQADLDASRVMIVGGSYGGYMTFACAFHYSDRIAGAASAVGISNFVTFLERTESYRRDLRRAEYGDERDPKMRAFMESIAPVNNADKIRKPLLVVQGLNDPRVPHTEAEQIVATLKKTSTPVWSIFAKDEGHGFVKKPNADYQFFATVEFARETLLK